jgi:hypothetical protein
VQAGFQLPTRTRWSLRNEQVQDAHVQYHDQPTIVGAGHGPYGHYSALSICDEDGVRRRGRGRRWSARATLDWVSESKVYLTFPYARREFSMRHEACAIH